MALKQKLLVYKQSRLKIATLIVSAVSVGILGYFIVGSRAAPNYAFTDYDLNDDKTINIFDLSILLSKWNTSDQNSDINKDGIVSVFDLSIMLSHWGETDNNPPSSDWQLIWSEEFDGTNLNTNSWSIRTGTEGHSQSNYLTGNVSVSNGSAKISTKRHCLSTSSEPLSGSNESSSPCGVSKITKYSSGYIESKVTWPSGRIEVKAKLPTSQRGVWPAIWLRNEVGWCGSNYGELDVMEWWWDEQGAQTADIATSTSHITCASNSTKKSQHYKDMATDLTTNWHIWAMEWDASGVRYEIDGQNVPSNWGDADKTTDTYADFSGVSSSVFNTILGQMWKIRLNTQIVKDDDSWHMSPDVNQSFPAVEYLIDYIKVFQKN